MFENSVEAHHSAFTQGADVLDMEHLEAAGVAIEVLDGSCTATAGPINVHLEEDEVRVGVLDHVVVHHLAFDFLELVAVVVVAVLEASSIAKLANFVKIVAVGLKVGDGSRNADARCDNVAHACGLVSSDTLLPPFKGRCKVVAVELFAAQAASRMRRDEPQTSLLGISLELFRRASVEFAVVIASCLESGVAPRGNLLHDGQVVTLAAPDGVAHGVELQTQLLLLRSALARAAADRKGRCKHEKKH